MAPSAAGLKRRCSLLKCIFAGVFPAVLSCFGRASPAPASQHPEALYFGHEDEEEHAVAGAFIHAPTIAGPLQRRAASAPRVEPNIQAPPAQALPLPAGSGAEATVAPTPPCAASTAPIAEPKPADKPSMTPCVTSQETSTASPSPTAPCTPSCAEPQPEVKALNRCTISLVATTTSSMAGPLYNPPNAEPRAEACALPSPRATLPKAAASSATTATTTTAIATTPTKTQDIDAARDAPSTPLVRGEDVDTRPSSSPKPAPEVEPTSPSTSQQTLAAPAPQPLAPEAPPSAGPLPVADAAWIVPSAAGQRFWVPADPGTGQGGFYMVATNAFEVLGLGWCALLAPESTPLPPGCTAGVNMLGYGPQPDSGVLLLWPHHLPAPAFLLDAGGAILFGTVYFPAMVPAYFDSHYLGVQLVDEPDVLRHAASASGWKGNGQKKSCRGSRAGKQVQARKRRAAAQQAAHAQNAECLAEEEPGVHGDAVVVAAGAAVEEATEEDVAMIEAESGTAATHLDVSRPMLPAVVQLRCDSDSGSGNTSGASTPRSNSCSTLAPEQAQKPAVQRAPSALGRS